MLSWLESGGFHRIVAVGDVIAWGGDDLEHQSKEIISYK
jgi:hypothetical protein